MVYERRHPRRSADDRIVERFTRREASAQRARRIARARVTVPKEVVAEFEQSLTADMAREARAIAAHLTHNTQETRTMTTKRNATTKRAEPTPATTKHEPKAKAAKKATAAKKTSKKAKPTDRATVLCSCASSAGRLKEGQRRTDGTSKRS